MAYKMPHDYMSDPSNFSNNFFASQEYFQDDFMDIQSSWMEKIDPLLMAPSQDAPPGWQAQRPPMQRFINQPERAFFTTPPQQQVFPQGMGRYSEPTTAFPRASGLRMVSPAPSQELSSTCSSARSPPAEHDYYVDTYYSPQQQDDFSIPMATSNLRHGLPAHQESWSGRPQIQSFSNTHPSIPCVNLSQVQCFADSQEVTFDGGDDDYTSMQSKVEYEVDNCHLRVPSSYRHSSDEGIGSSIRGDGSPRDSTSAHHADNDNDEDLDADAEADTDYDPTAENEIIVCTAHIDAQVESESDTEYTPKNPRSRKRRATKSSPTASSVPSTKRSRPIKSPSSVSNKSNTTCLTCPARPTFKNPASLQRHIISAHTRPFLCVFAFAGCSSTFASKNEWKRHVATQHLCLSVWVCRMGACARGSSHAQGGVEFNRKDLFTQHLRRMHDPEKRGKKAKAELERWEERIRQLQTECLTPKREAPGEVGCTVRGCGKVFKGRGAWDERMEHVGRHLEKGGADTSEGMDNEGVDRRLLEWAVREGVVGRRRGGGWAFCGSRDEESSRSRGPASARDVRRVVDVDEDEDADGEEE